MIEFKSVTKRYGTVEAVRDLSFTLARGQIVGLLGQNGAGKSTTLNLLTGYLSPSAGQILVDGHDMQHEPRAARQAMGYLPEVPPLYDEMTVESYLRFACALHLVVRKDIADHVRDVANKTGLSDMLSRRVGNLSKGYRQRVGLAQALCGDPDILVLDEPTAGLDPRQTAEFRDTVRRIAKGRTVIFSSHILSEVQQLCDRVMILHRGQLVYDKPLNGQTGKTRLHARILGDEKVLLPALRSLTSVTQVTRLPAAEKGALDAELVCSDLRNAQKELFTLLTGLSAPILQLTGVDDTLEDVFLRYTGKN